MTLSSRSMKTSLVAFASLLAVTLSGFEFAPASRKAVITVASGVPSHVQFAAKELAEHYELATGVALEILESYLDIDPPNG